MSGFYSFLPSMKSVPEKVVTGPRTLELQLKRLELTHANAPGQTGSVLTNLAAATQI